MAKSECEINGLLDEIGALKKKIGAEIVRCMNGQKRVDLTETAVLDTESGELTFIGVESQDPDHLVLVYADHYAPPGSEGTVEYDDLTCEDLLCILRRMP